MLNRTRLCSIIKHATVPTSTRGIPRRVAMQDRPVRQNGRTGRVPRESSRAARDSTALHTWRDLGLELACVITQFFYDELTLFGTRMY